MSTNTMQISKVGAPSRPLVNDWRPFKTEDHRIAVIEAGIVGLVLLGTTGMFAMAYLVS